MDGDCLIKRQCPLLSRLERERSQFGARVGTACGLFQVPEVLSFDDSAGEIVFGFVPDAVRLRDYLVDRPEPELLRRCGSILAAIHSACFDAGQCDVCWHGDFALGNLLYSESRDTIAVIDWSNVPWLLEPACRSRGPAALDLGVAVISLFHPRGVRARNIPDPEGLSMEFLTSYVQGREGFRIDSVRPFIVELNRRWRRCVLLRSGILRTLTCTRSLVRLSVFWSTVITNGL